VSVVTGASRGIGFAAAASLGRAGSTIAVVDVKASDAEAAARRLAEEGIEARGFACDVRDPAGVRSAVEAIANAFGAVDHAINNAGVQFVAPFADFPEDKWEFVRAVNLDGVFSVTQAVWPHLLARGRGRIVNIASVHGLVASPFKPAYVAAKHGVVGLTKAAALEGAAHGITVNAVCPGAVMTDLIRGQAPDLVRSYGGNISEEEALDRAFLGEMPTRRFIEPDEVGELCAYLCSDAARSITGAAISIDGGWAAH
jgi:3-hydroxybutyrate dehydrogenase